MANFKVVISDPKSKKAFQKEIEQKASGFMGKRVGEKVRGDAMGFSGYEFQVTGGSDAQGFPMRRDVEGQARKKVLLSRGTGFRTNVKGKRKRKSVRGNTISAEISQINAKIVTYGSKPLAELAGKAEKRVKDKDLSEEERKAKLAAELQSKVDKTAPEKSRSDQIREELEAQEKAKADKPSDAPKGAEDKPEEKKGAEPAKEAAPEAKAEEKPSPEDRPAEDKPKKKPSSATKGTEDKKE